MRPILALLLCLPLPLGAQTWEFGRFDTGAWFEAHAFLPGRAAEIHCGGVSPGGQPLPQSDEPMLTGPYAMALSLRMPGVADFTRDAFEPRHDLAEVIGATGYRLPTAHWDAINGYGWQVDLPVGDPLLLALRGAQAFAVDTAAGRAGVFSAAGASQALDRALAFCDAGWAATGAAVPPQAAPWVQAVRAAGLAAPPAAPAPGGLAAAVEAHATRNCGGPFRRGADWLRSAELDGDGQPDFVLEWSAVECTQGPPRPFCGAAQCSTDVFLLRLSAHPRTLGLSRLRDDDRSGQRRAQHAAPFVTRHLRHLCRRGRLRRRLPVGGNPLAAHPLIPPARCLSGRMP